MHIISKSLCVAEQHQQQQYNKLNINMEWELYLFHLFICIDFPIPIHPFNFSSIQTIFTPVYKIHEMFRHVYVLFSELLNCN